MSRRHLINTANLHVGGAIQVASSFFKEVMHLKLSTKKVSISMSSEVSASFGRPDTLKEVGAEDVVQFDIRGFDPWNRKAQKFFDQFESVFTVFGPLYRWNTPFRSIVGFAQPWIIYPHNEVYAMLPLSGRIRSRLKFWIQSAFFKRADLLVVELDHVKEGLVRELGIDPGKIRVVRNCVSSIYKDKSTWASLEIPAQDFGLKFGFIGRNYPHKNTAIFPEIIQELREKHGIDAKFYVTFTDEEWQETSPDFKENCINVGLISPSQCPEFYQAMDAIVFPSLLECFSATPLEAMAMEKPLFASDRRFNRDICDDHATYFDPLSSKAAAEAIVGYLGKNGPDPIALGLARDHAFSFSSPAERAQQYLALLQEPDGPPQ